MTYRHPCRIPLAVCQALGIPFQALGAAELCPDYRQVILKNNERHVRHLYYSLEDMLAEKPCSLHPAVRGCCPCAANQSISLGVTGSPCNPYSTRRCKRFSDESIKNHAMTNTTMCSVIDFYKKWEPRAGITEQVKGFGMRMSSSDPTTPCEKLLVSIQIQTKPNLSNPVLQIKALAQVSGAHGPAAVEARRVLVREAGPGRQDLDADQSPQDHASLLFRGGLGGACRVSAGFEAVDSELVRLVALWPAASQTVSRCRLFGIV